ncbi:MAG: hypothetical protein ABFE07_13600, partial [Armatimonadia bacterium]
MKRVVWLALLIAWATPCLSAAGDIEPRLPSTADLPQATGNLPCAMSYLRILVWGDGYDSYAWLSADGKSLAYESSDHSWQGSRGQTTRADLYDLKTGAIWHVPGGKGYQQSHVGGWSPDQKYLLWSSVDDWVIGLRGRLGITNRSGRSRCLLQASRLRSLLPGAASDATKKDALNIDLFG